jgi:hypothetical protein
MEVNIFTKKAQTKKGIKFFDKFLPAYTIGLNLTM